MTSVDALPVETVLEARAECPDDSRAQAALADALGAARAPRRAAGGSSWTLTVRVSRAPGARRGLEATAEIADDRGTLVAERTVTDRSAKACMPLARAVGAWATLVLDAEMNRAKDAAASAEPRPSAPAASASQIERDASLPVPAEAPASPAPQRTVEIGAMMFLRNGVSATGGVGGVSPYVSIEVAPSWMLRPALQLGWATGRTALDPNGDQTATFTQYAVRVDFCRRVPGNYIERRGIELDLCGGADGGILVLGNVQQEPAFRGAPAPSAARGNLALGPAAMLRGELGAGIALEVRGMIGMNVLRHGFASEGDVPLASADGELGVSWRLP